MNVGGRTDMPWQQLALNVEANGEVMRNTQVVRANERIVIPFTKMENMENQWISQKIGTLRPKFFNNIHVT